MRDASKVVLGVGSVLFWVAQLLLYYVAEVAIADSIMLAVLLIAVPTLTFSQMPMLDAAAVERIPAYWGSIATVWLLGTSCWLVGMRDGGLVPVGAAALPAVTLLLWGMVLTGVGLLTMVVFRQLAGALGVEESAILKRLLPRTREERRVFAVLSVAAGFGEEIAYRGYALGVLIPILGTATSALLTSAVFGALHSYQGTLGVVRTFVVGVVFAWGFVASGSVWPGVVAHTAIDLLGGLVLSDWLVSPREADRVLIRPHPRLPGS